MEKRCSTCQQRKPLSEFHKGTGSHDRQSHCKVCAAARLREWRSNNRERENQSRLNWNRSNPEKVEQYARTSSLRKYGLNLEDYDQMLEAQGGKCFICRRHCSSGRRLAVDHNHVTGKVRALLCSNCNRGIGHFQESIELLRAAINYLEGSWSRETSATK